MFYSSVWVRSSRYHGNEPLTYASDIRLKTGSIVEVELQKRLVLGVVSGPTTKPRFQVKPIERRLDLPVLPQHLLKLAEWMQSYYPAPIGILAQQLIPAGFSEKHLVSAELDELSLPELQQLPELTDDQQQAVSSISERGSYILHGITGSGKTRVYIELAAKALIDNKSSLILTPEISLTTQLAASFEQVYANRVVVIHSNQTPAERQKAWLKILRAKEPMIVIGPRSALFSPVANLGLIVIDEAHETAYKQEQAPQYQTGRVAAYLASQTRSILVLGSATPSVSDYYLAEQKHRPIIEMNHLAKPPEHGKTEVQVIDRRDRDQFSRSAYLSQSLLKAVEKALANDEQTLLYLNRRGTARLVMCESCGWQAACPNCNVPLVYHGDDHQLRCHSCDYHARPPANCPDCGHSDILFKTAGTKAIVDEVKKLFPQAKVSRFDTDNTKAERFEQQFETVKKGDVDILVGTQLLAKGLDLPKLSTLGVLLADTSLYLPDFSAQERTYQLISQVLGRVGRGHLAGTAIIQTYHPDHPVLQDALNGNYQKFYRRELDERRQFLFPPFCYLLKISVRRATIASAQAAAEKIKDEIEHSGHKVRVEGPAPSFYERLQNKYQWQLVIKARDRQQLLEIIKALPANCAYDIDPLDLL